MIPSWARLQLDPTMLAIVPLQAGHLREVLLLLTQITLSNLLIHRLVGRVVVVNIALLLKSPLTIRPVLWNATRQVRLIESAGEVDHIVGGVDVVD